VLSINQKDSRPLKILIYEPYSIKVYGNTRYLIGIFKFVDRARFEPILAAPFQDYFLDIIRRHNGRTIVVPAPERLKRYSGSILEDDMAGRLLTSACLLRHSFTLASIIIQENIDVVQCNSIRAISTIGLAAKVTGRPCFWYVKGELDNPLLDKIGFALADRVLFQCETNKNRRYPELVRKYEKKIHILTNGIDLEEVATAQQNTGQQLRNELCIDKQNINVAFLGQLYAPKGIDYLLKAMAKVRKVFSKVALYLVGDYGTGQYQNYKAELNSIIESKNLEKIYFLGWRSDALEILSLMDIYAFPSLSEGVPRSIMEAMALGKPVVATSVGGIPDLVRNGETGFLVEARNSDGLANAILTLAKNKELRTKFGEKARSIAFKECSIKDNIVGLENLYLELAKNFR
jgi:glycosyltransferase involved in cell wall biosynthesis